MRTTAIDMLEAYIKAKNKFFHGPYKKDLNKLDEEMERNVIEMIKAIGNHIGDPEAKLILSCLKKDQLPDGK